VRYRNGEPSPNIARRRTISILWIPLNLMACHSHCSLAVLFQLQSTRAILASAHSHKQIFSWQVMVIVLVTLGSNSLMSPQYSSIGLKRRFATLFQW